MLITDKTEIKPTKAKEKNRNILKPSGLDLPGRFKKFMPHNPVAKLSGIKIAVTKVNVLRILFCL